MSNEEDVKNAEKEVSDFLSIEIGSIEELRKALSQLSPLAKVMLEKIMKE